MSENKPYQDESKLRELYVKQGLTMEEIADKFDVSARTISKWVNKFEVRTGGKGAGEPYDVSITSDGRNYLRAESQHNGETDRVLLHRLAAVAKYGIEEVKGKDVHHKNRVRWDNRLENIELLDTAEHSRLHAIEQHRGRESAT